MGDTHPALIVVAGGIASGKSTLSRALADRLGAERIEADRIRRMLLSPGEASPGGVEACWRQDFSAGFEAEIYDDLLQRAGALLASGRSVVLDACFPRRAQRRAARLLAARRGARFLLVDCRIPEETLRARLAARDRAAGREGWAFIAQRLADAAEPIDARTEGTFLEVDGDGEPAAAADAIASRLATIPSPARGAPPTLDPLPRAVSFDCWSTLIAEQDWPWAHGLRVRALRDAAREAGREVSEEAAEAAFDAAWRQHMDGWNERKVSGAPEVARWGLERLGIVEAHPALEHLVRRYEEASHTSHVIALPGAAALLRALTAEGIPSVLVCDTGLTPGRVVRRLLDRHGLLEHLRVQIFSDEIGAPKPDPRPFLAALSPLGIGPGEAIHVGDLRRTDVAGGRALGMRTVRIRGHHDDAAALPEADYVVDSHAQLAALLGLELESEGGTP